MTLTQTDILARAYRGKTTVERFWEKVSKKDSGCWLWNGTIDVNGYGRLGIGDDYWGAHRLSWVIKNGDVPEGLFVLHKCDVRNCTNPEHLFLGTYKDNLEDAIKKGRWVAGKGSAIGTSKLKESQVEQIKTLYSTTQITQAELASQFGVKENCIGHIVAGRSWKHVCPHIIVPIRCRSNLATPKGAKFTAGINSPQ